MRRRFALSCLLLGLVCNLGALAADDAASKKPHIVFVTGDDEYRSEITMPMLAEILKQRHGFECTVLYAIDSESGKPNPKFKTNIPGLEALKNADLAVFYTRFRALPDEQLKMILDYVNSGRPAVGLRTATHAFLYPDDSPNKKWNDEFGRSIFGQKWITHHGHLSSTDVTEIPEKARHPILLGIEPTFHCASWLYHVEPLVGDCEPLLMGKSLNSDKMDKQEQYPLVQPVAWTKTFTGESGKPARIFFTTLGHPADFENESMRRLMINGIYWALGMEDKISENGSDAQPVKEFVAPPTH